MALTIKDYVDDGTKFFIEFLAENKRDLQLLAIIAGDHLHGKCIDTNLKFEDVNLNCCNDWFLLRVVYGEGDRITINILSATQ